MADAAPTKIALPEGNSVGSRLAGILGSTLIVFGALAAHPAAQAGGLATVSEGMVGRMGLQQAVDYAVDHNPSVRLAWASTKQEQGHAREASGPFSSGVDLASAIGRTRKSVDELPGAHSVQDRLAMDLNWSRLFRNGLSLTPGFGIEGVGATVSGQQADSILGETASQTTYRSRVSVALAVPLARGRGTGSSRASERAALLQAEAARDDYFHAASEAVLESSTAYWDLVACQARSQVLGETVKVFDELVTTSENLLAAREITQSDAGEIRARAQECRADLASRREDELRARIALATAIGMRVLKIGDAPTAGDSWPAPPGDSSEVAAWNTGALRETALAHRFDLAASRAREASNRILAEGAKGDQRRKLDLSAAIALDGAHEDARRFTLATASSGFREAIGALSDHWGATAALVLEWPHRNDEARGRYQQAMAAADQQAIARSDLERRIALDVDGLRRSIGESLEEQMAVSASVESYGQTVQSQVGLFRRGEATAADLIQTQQDLLGAELRLIDVMRTLSLLRSRLRFALGIMIRSQAAEEGGIRLHADPLGSGWID